MKKWLFIPLAFLLAGCGQVRSASESTDAGDEVDAGYKKITAQEAKRIMDEDAPYYLLDVRTEEEYAEKRIEGAVLIPHIRIEQEAEDMLPDKDRIILVYCRSGARSAVAAEALAQMGYTNVYDFGGIIDWPYDTIAH